MSQTHVLTHILTVWASHVLEVEDGKCRQELVVVGWSEPQHQASMHLLRAAVSLVRSLWSSCK